VASNKSVVVVAGNNAVMCLVYDCYVFMAQIEWC
jgi:hypothetical protein